VAGEQVDGGECCFCERAQVVPIPTHRYHCGKRKSG
jgi:hypothetical protein